MFAALDAGIRDEKNETNGKKARRSLLTPWRSLASRLGDGFSGFGRLASALFSKDHVTREDLEDPVELKKVIKGVEKVFIHVLNEVCETPDIAKCVHMLYCARVQAVLPPSHYRPPDHNTRAFDSQHAGGVRRKRPRLLFWVGLCLHATQTAQDGTSGGRHGKRNRTFDCFHG
jgi:hypothetical protein